MRWRCIVRVAGVLSCIWVVPVAAAQPLELPWAEPFGGAALDPGWAVDVSQGNAVSVRDGSLVIRAAENTFAHIERKLDTDPIRVSCAIRPGAGISWATSIFVYWGPGDWCQLAPITRGGGRYYVCLTANGQRNEQDVGQCNPAEFSRVAIELGTDVVRFLAGAGGQTWRPLLLLDRPERFSGPPALLVVGKGFGLDATAADLDGDYGQRGEFTESMVRDLGVQKTEPGRLRLTDEERRQRERADQDPLGTQVLESGREPSFEAVDGLLPPLSKPREACGAKEGRYELGVEYDGTIQLDTGIDGWEQNGPTVWFEIGDPPVRFGAAGCKKRLQEGYLPVVICQATADGLDLEQTVFGWSEGMKPDTELWGYVRLEVRNNGSAERTVPIRVKSQPAEISRLAPVLLRVPAGGREQLCVRIPSPARNAGVTQVEFAEYAGRLRETADYWKRELNSRTVLVTPERRVNEAWRAWLAYNFIDVDKAGEVYEPHDGAGFYEAVYGYSEVLYGHALDMWGFHDESRRYLESMFSHMQPDGLFAINYGLPDHGGLLFALAEHYRFTGDGDWLRKVAPRMLQMCDWAVKRREAATSSGVDRADVTYGLIKFRPYCDYPTETYNYYANAYCCIGLEHAAAVLRDIGLSEQADRIAGQAAAYRRDILASMDAAVIERDGMKLLPMEPDSQRLLKDSNYQCGDYYGLVASMFLESEFLPADDPRALMVAAGLEKRRGLILGMCEFQEGIDHAYTYGYWLNCLRRNDVDRVLLGLYGSLAYGMGRETYCGVEVTAIATGEPTPTMPHLYSGTQQLRLLRMMLLHESGDQLVIGKAMPAAWLKAGEPIEMRNAPTIFGPMSFTIAPQPDLEQVRVEIQPPMRRPPRSIVVHIRHPGGKQIRSATVDGAECRTFEGDNVTIDQRTAPMRIVVGF